jgi:hypothetical protein
MFNVGHLSADFRRHTFFNTRIFVLPCKPLMLFVDVYLKIKPSLHRCSRMVVWKMPWFWFVGLCESVREMGVATCWHNIRIFIRCEGTGYIHLPQQRDQWHTVVHAAMNLISTKSREFRGSRAFRYSSVIPLYTNNTK